MDHEPGVISLISRNMYPSWRPDGNEFHGEHWNRVTRLWGKLDRAKFKGARLNWMTQCHEAVLALQCIMDSLRI